MIDSIRRQAAGKKPGRTNRRTRDTTDMDIPYSIPLPVALAAIAVLGYLAGRRTRAHAITEADKARRELRRAKVVARELEQIAEGVRKQLATHHLSVARFKDRVAKLNNEEKDAAWQDLCAEAEQILKPTLRLAEQIALAYDEIRQQTNQLMTFSEVRTDPLTRVSNRRCLDETLDSMFALLERYDESFSLAIFDIDHFKQVNDKKGHLFGDRTLQAVARILDETVRDTDIVARYGGEEFVVVMPHTSLDDACTFAERVRKLIDESLALTVSGGVAMALDGDNAQSLLSRADAALYSGKAAGRNRIFRHTGADIEPIESDANRLLEPAEALS
jgi:diguanylate cyclase